MTTKSDQTIVLSESETPEIFLVDIPGIGKKYVKISTANSTNEQTTAQFEPNEVARQQSRSLPSLAGASSSFVTDDDLSQIDLFSSEDSLTSGEAIHVPAEPVSQVKQLVQNWSVNSENDSESGNWIKLNTIHSISYIHAHEPFIDNTDDRRFDRQEFRGKRTSWSSWEEPAAKKAKESNENITEEDLLKFGRLLNKLVNWTNANDSK